jgi:hypothetical protein
MTPGRNNPPEGTFKRGCSAPGVLGAHAYPRPARWQTSVAARQACAVNLSEGITTSARLQNRACGRVDRQRVGSQGANDRKFTVRLFENG